MTDTPNTVPVVSVVGKSDSGKTTFIEKLIRELTSRGVRVASVKHHVHDYDIDIPGKDSWRHGRAGSVVTMVSSPEKFALIREVEEEVPLPVIARIAYDSGCDILITEGFKREGLNRIEISRAERSSELICSAEEMLALVTDNPLVTCDGVPRFDLEDAAGVADLVQERFLEGLSARGGA